MLVSTICHGWKEEALKFILPRSIRMLCRPAIPLHGFNERFHCLVERIKEKE